MIKPTTAAPAAAPAPFTAAWPNSLAAPTALCSIEPSMLRCCRVLKCLSVCKFCRKPREVECGVRLRVTPNDAPDEEELASKVDGPLPVLPFWI